MKPQSPATCDSQTIDDFLAGSLGHAANEAFERHLDECDDCCGELQQRTADVGLWNDARAYLSSTENLFDDDDDTAGGPVKGDTLRLDFLAPTDDPRMLGRFAGCEITGAIGSGGMGIVLKGFDTALNRYSAIKVLAPHFASSGAARKRFAREAQAAAAVVHDNVIAIHGVDEFNGLPYLVMPYVKGESLQKRIDREGSLGTTEVLRIAMQVAKGLAAAHDQGLVHRDIKPANILLPENVERVMITDFGLARAADDASLTRSGVIAGTPQYMSPEQARGEGIDGRSDLFSMGSVMYAMCAGHAPFRAETPYGILRRITDHEARPIREVNADVPEWLSHIIVRLLAKRASDRFESAEQVATLLEDCLAHVQHPTVVPLPAALDRPGRKRWLALSGVLAAFVVAVIAPTFFAKPNPSHDTSPLALSSHHNAQSDATPDRTKDASANEASAFSVNSGDENTVESVTEEDLVWDVDTGIESLSKNLAELNAELDLPETAEVRPPPQSPP